MTANLPVYGVREIPDGLATVTMLRRMRRKPAPDQAPAGILRYSRGKDTTHLFTVADTVAMRPLTARQRAAAEASRVYPRHCEVCGWDAGGPLPSNGRGAHRCPACDAEDRYDQVRAWRAQQRSEASAWAAEALADPTAMVVATRSIDLAPAGPGQTVKRTAVAELVVVSLADPAVDRLHITLIPDRRPKRKRDLPAGGRLVEAAAPGVAAWVTGRRVVAWSEWEVSALDWDLRDAGVQPPRPGTRLIYLPRLRAMSHQYSQWCGHIGSAGVVDQSRPPGGPVEEVDWIVDTLRRMAASPVRGVSQ
ncbi:hypothetical protein [Solwaraspora sp. WMMD792]|uniref:hypothetical protein n=1 Tax=Solwaraspora sp. WMMD792 TaxID=3016099 RepID=UPI002417CA93|nr:hypothetical protein [Solwaraspora sp. WMMD792]MDG4768752.1 hypothetical protein [Solwaraspora sp. WMMD792]MDG4768791.1 hypothetical protein [Solwaraspora sp. WMMD792]MDG4768831.1 hypothetical protein [Solwaraspora sp. WMMD792]MDG4768853.1 hypothetical protein [Solwaraspora sp. WMMD792]MDG4768886.1 hypothetical protein [Solwaraspora sp. WMMD792]